MKRTKYSPMLAPNDVVDLSTIKYPILASTKLDGIRCIFHPELGMVSRSLKPIQNKQLREKFQPILAVAKQCNVILDGEIYSQKRTFQAITRAVMTKDLYDTKKQKDFGKDYCDKLINDMMFHCFDCLNFDLVDCQKEEFVSRNSDISTMTETLALLMVHVKQILVHSESEVKELFHEMLDAGYEGLILKDPTGYYKFGRATLKEGTGYKVKPFIEKSGIIKGFVQATKVDPSAEKKTNELGRSVTSKKKDDRILIEKIAAFVIDYEGQDLKVVVAATDVEKEQLWKDREKYLGKELNYKSMEVGQKEGGLPRHPVATKIWKVDA